MPNTIPAIVSHQRIITLLKPNNLSSPQAQANERSERSERNGQANESKKIDIKKQKSAHGATITLAPLLGIFTSPPLELTGPIGFVVAGTASSHESSWRDSVEGSAEYQEPA